MMDKRPIRIDVVRIERGKQKLCQCSRPRYSIDVNNRTVECEDCGAIIDPYDALLKIARKVELMNDYHKAMIEEREAIVGYEPRLLVMKELSKKYTGKNSKMVPRCPHCHVPFELHDLLETLWCDRHYLPKPPKEADHE